MTNYAIFIVEDEESTRDGIVVFLEDRYRVRAFGDAESAIEAVRSDVPDLVLLDIGLPGMDGVEALKVMKGLCPGTQFIMITAHEEVPTVVAAVKGGAASYVVKPLHMDALEVDIGNALDTIRLKRDVEALQEMCLRESFPCFVGASDAIQGVMEFVEAIAKSPDTPVLILGETGTGKELIASAIHYRSPNFRGPLVSLNCSAISSELIESELFGYEKGAFSGASAAGKLGLVEGAEGGTLFLDEVGDLSLDAQAKLLRFLENGEYYRVGGTRKFRVRLRVVCATNKDLKSRIEEGLFREDLYFRIAVVKVEVPSLNERREDIVPIARHFLAEFSRKFGKTIAGIDPDAEATLKRRKWRGNIRELRNMIELGVLRGRGPDLTLSDIGLQDAVGSGRCDSGDDREEELSFPPLPPDGIDLIGARDSLERHFIGEALRTAQGNESGAARLLRINHQTFRYRRKKLSV